MQSWLFLFIGAFFIFLMTALGSAVVFLFKGEIPEKLNAVLLGFASGVMVSASVFSLIIPSISLSQPIFGVWSFLPPTVGVLLGGFFLYFLDNRIPAPNESDKIGFNANKLFWAVTLHNIPEGLAVGFAFGSCMAGDMQALLSALFLAFGIGVQNFPEGAAVSLPMKSVCADNKKAFFYGVKSGIAEPIFALLGFLLAGFIQPIQPFLLSFSAGAMLLVVAQDLLPVACQNTTKKTGGVGYLIGFTIMLILDIALA